MVQAPALLGTGIHPFLPQQQHHRLQVHAQIRPLGGVHLPVHIAEQRRRRPKELVVTGEPRQSPGLVLAGDFQQGVHILADLEAIVPVGSLETFGVNVVFRVLTLRRFLHPFGHDVLELFQVLTTNHIQLPWLKVTAGGRTSGFLQNAPDDLAIHRLVGKGADRVSAGHGIRDRRGRLGHGGSVIGYCWFAPIVAPSGGRGNRWIACESPSENGC